MNSMNGTNVTTPTGIFVNKKPTKKEYVPILLQI